MHWYLEVWKQYAVFSGRSRRTEYWSFILCNLAILIVLRIIDGLTDSSGMIMLIYSLAVLIPSIAVSVRRLHDTDRSGWWLLVTLFPFFGVLVLLMFMAQDSDPKRNQYGPNPKQAFV